MASAFSSMLFKTPARDFLFTDGRLRNETGLSRGANFGVVLACFTVFIFCAALTCAANDLPPRTNDGRADLASTLPFISPAFLYFETRERNSLNSLEDNCEDFLYCLFLLGKITHLSVRERDSDSYPALLRSIVPGINPVRVTLCVMQTTP